MFLMVYMESLTLTLPRAAKIKSTATENLEKSEHDFTITSSEKTPLTTSTQNILTIMNIISLFPEMHVIACANAGTHAS